MKKAFLVATMSVAALVLSACSTQFTEFEDAYTTCGSPSGVVVLDEGKTIVVDMMGEDQYDGATGADLYCIVMAVKTPSYVISQMESTNALAGTQSATYDGISVSWNYHPDNGLDIVYHKE